MRPPRAIKASAEYGLTRMMGARPNRPPNSTSSPTVLPGAGMMRTAVVLLLTMPMAASSAMMADDGRSGRITRHRDHIQSNGTDAGHRFQLFKA